MHQKVPHGAHCTFSGARLCTRGQECFSSAREFGNYISTRQGFAAACLPKPNKHLSSKLTTELGRVATLSVLASRAVRACAWLVLGSCSIGALLGRLALCSCCLGCAQAALCLGGSYLGRARFGPVRARFVPGSSLVRARIAHGSRTDRARFVSGLPGSCPVRARFVPGLRPVRARFAPSS